MSRVPPPLGSDKSCEKELKIKSAESEKNKNIFLIVYNFFVLNILKLCWT